MIKAVFFDIDGTILSHDPFGIPQSTVRAIRQLQAQGIRCVIATGRHIREMEDLPVWELAMDGYVTLNGQVVLDENRRVLWDQPLTERQAAGILELFHSRRVPVMLVERDRMYLNFVNEGVEQTHREISTPVPPLGTYEGAPIYMGIFYADPQLEREISGCFRDCMATRWHPRAMDVISSTGGKATGIRHYLEHYGIAREETMAFGDGDNDKEMLAYAGIGVAMGNAVPTARAAADYVTADLNRDGIEKALLHFGVLK